MNNYWLRAVLAKLFICLIFQRLKLHGCNLPLTHVGRNSYYAARQLDKLYVTGL